MDRAKRLKKNTEEYFDWVARTGEIISEPILCYAEVLRQLEDAEGDRLIDMGCGTGRMLHEIVEHYPGRFLLFGLDLSGESIKQAGTLLGDHADLTTGDVEDLPYPDNTFDYMLCMHSFHHYPNPVQSLAEMRRVMKIGGILLLVDNNYPFMERIRINFSMMRRRHDKGDVKMYSAGELQRLVRSAGFKISFSESIAEHSLMIKCKK